jgi:trehalose synthase
VWRSHNGVEAANERVGLAWDFLNPFLETADACVFSRPAYVPDWANAVRTEIIQPSIDVFSAKNQEMSMETVHAILECAGLLAGSPPSTATPAFKRQDGSPGRVDRTCEVTSHGPLPGADTPLVVQVSRWDRLKDPEGVMLGFAGHVLDGTNAQLMLAGPAARAVADDPEGAEVLDETTKAWRELSPLARSRVHLACLPMADIEENAAIVNALQRQATIVAQKSLQEGFGLTVAEAMWKSRPVIASAVGGIKEQVEDGVTGLLLDDPRDLAAFGKQIVRLLGDRELASTLGANARERVRRQFLANRHALQYIGLFQEVLRR